MEPELSILEFLHNIFATQTNSNDEFLLLVDSVDETKNSVLSLVKYRHNNCDYQDHSNYPHH